MIGFYRNGETQFSFDPTRTDADDVIVVMKADGSKDVSLNGNKKL